jgi:hypothetical protein
MNSGMPRYALSDDEFASLQAYLATLSAQTSPGVSDDKVHFATVIQPGVDAAKRRALVDVLQAYIDDRNAGLRFEVRKHIAGSVRLGRTYREWVLHVWDLTGPGDGWGTQLESLNRQQPVFALISGLGNASWRPIHDFSEKLEIPCIFPQTDLPVTEGQGVYTVYLSRGMVLEATALAKYLIDVDSQAPVTQIFRNDGASVVAADAFRKAWRENGRGSLRERLLDGQADTGFWRDVVAARPNSTLVLWLSPGDLVDARAIVASGSSVKSIYLSSTLQAGTRWDIGPDAGHRVRLIYPLDTPEARARRVETVKLWLHKKGIELTDEIVQMNAYLAAMVTAGEVSHAMDSFSRDLLLERIEHRVGNALDPSMYPHLSLGPGQRFASKGSYVVESDGARIKPVSAWVVP